MKQELLQQIEDLKNVIAWSKEHGGLTSGQRMCIHQEIAGILQNIDAEESGEVRVLKSCRLGFSLKEKVSHISGVIKNTKWIKQEIKY